MLTCRRFRPSRPIRPAPFVAWIVIHVVRSGDDALDSRVVAEGSSPGHFIPTLVSDIDRPSIHAAHRRASLAIDFNRAVRSPGMPLRNSFGGGKIDSKRSEEQTSEL